MNTVIAIVNQKGGVGKTTTAVNIAHGMALSGRRVLLVDLDPQGNVSDSFNIAPTGDLCSWLSNEEPGVFITWARDNLSIVRGDKTTANLKTLLAARGFSEFVLVDKLAELGFYDLTVLDCAPSLDILHVAAVMAADWLIIPTKLDQFAVKGVGDTIESMRQLSRRGSRCKLAGILPTFWERQTTETQKQLENLVNAFGSDVWAPVAIDTRIREASRAGQTIWEYAANSRALVDGYIPACANVARLLGE